MPEGLSVFATLSKITTTADGGWRVSFDLDQSEAKNVAILAQLRDMLFNLGIVPCQPERQEAE